MLTSLLPSYISLAVNTTAAHQAACESYVSAASVGVDYLRLIHPDTYALTEVSIRARLRPTENDSKSEIRLKSFNTGGSDVLFEKKDVHGGPLTLGKVNSSGTIRWETGEEWHPNECNGFYQTSTLSLGVVLFYHPVKKRFQMKYYDNLWWTREFSGYFEYTGCNTLQEMSDGKLRNATCLDDHLMWNDGEIWKRRTDVLLQNNTTLSAENVSTPMETIQYYSKYEQPSYATSLTVL